MRPPVTDEPRLPSASLGHLSTLYHELKLRDDPARGLVRGGGLIRHAGALFQRGARLSGCDDFGLRLGARHRLEDLGTPGFLLLTASSVGTMLEVLDRYGRLIQDRAFSAVLDLGTIELCYTAPLIDPEQRRQDAEFSLAYMLATTRAALGTRLVPREVSFEHEAPASVRAHQALFGCAVRFGRPANRIVFPRAAVALPVVTADAALFDHLSTYVESGFGVDLDTAALLRIVGGLVVSLLDSGEPSLDGVAQRLDLSPRTLQRRLAEGGASFGDLIDSIRRELAARHVLDSDLPMTEIAQLLGYSESAAFTRSYRRWHGLSPSRHRRQRGTNPAS
jgi:AraC-like DNA-binding protein